MNEDTIEPAASANEQPNDQPQAQSAEAKINANLGKVDACVEKALGLIGNHPWEKWLGTFNGYIERFLPAVIALSGVAAFAVGLVVAIRYDMPISVVLSCVIILVLTAFSMHLAPKSLSLARSLVEKGELAAMRPEYVYINKVLWGLGGLVASLYLLLQFDTDAFICALVVALIAMISIIVYSNPAIAGVKIDYPQNSVEEIITILMFPLKLILALLTPIIGIAVVIGLVYGVVQLFDDGTSATMVFLATAIAPLLVPLAVYFSYLLLTFVFELYRAIVSVPRRLEEIRKAVSGEKS